MLDCELAVLDALPAALTSRPIAAPKAAWLKQFGHGDDWQMASLLDVLHLDGSAAFESKALRWSRGQYGVRACLPQAQA